jgi:pimeloyl-ACP methyl ester carboxylesterase
MAFFKTSDGVKLFYREKGDGPALVLIHGWSADHRRFIQLFHALSKQYRVIVYDQRGHGQSGHTSSQLTLKRLATDLKELMASLDIKNAVIGGWSMGGSTVFEYSRLFGTEGLAGICIFDMTPKVVNDASLSLGLYHGKYTLEDAVDSLARMCEDWPREGAAFVRTIAPYLKGDMLDVSVREIGKNDPYVMTALWLAMVQADYRAILPQIDVPALIAYGDKSTLYAPETAFYLGEHIPDAEVVPFEDCTHLLIIENPKKAIESVGKFAERVFSQER